MSPKNITVKCNQLVHEASFRMRPDLRRLLIKAYHSEQHTRAKKALFWILENARIARSESLALCQDTGLPVVFLEIGKGASLKAQTVEAIKKSVQASYKKLYLRPSSIDPLTRIYPSYKEVIIHIHTTLRAKGIRITLFPKGFGSENKSQLKMFNPTASWQEIEDFIIQSVKDAGPAGCPPFIVGIGIGGTSEEALLYAKKGLCHRIDKHSPFPGMRTLEAKLLRKINSLGIGPMGMGGKTTALAVKITKRPTHIAGLPVGVNISCWALRSASTILR